MGKSFNYPHSGDNGFPENADGIAKGPKEKAEAKTEAEPLESKIDEFR